MNIVLLGGSKFMGLATLKLLIAHEGVKTIFVINRGYSYWNDKFNEIVNEKVTHIKLDRKNKEEFNICITKLTKENYINYFIDFSCYKAKELPDLTSIIFGKYIYISTDSVYNASEIGQLRNIRYFFEEKNPPLITEDQVSFNPDNIDKYIDKDDYGYNKLLCELAIKEQLCEVGKYYFIRLPDVLGPYDDTYRLWYYLIWLKHEYIKSIEIEEVDTIRKLSFVFSEDVARFIIFLIDNNPNSNVFNLSCDENITLKEFIEFVNVKSVDFKIIEGGYAHTYYPSVTIGAISNKKVKDIGFKFSTLYDAINESVKFFKSAEIYLKEYKKMIGDLPKEIRKFIIKN
jgi:hypothetical protein